MYSCVRPYSSQIIFFPPVKNGILFVTAGKNRISFVTLFEHICHSSWDICDRSQSFMYHLITFFTGQKVHDLYNQKVMFYN